VARQARDACAIHHELQIRLQGVRLFLWVHRLVFHVDRKRLDVLRLLCGILDRRPGPCVKGIAVDPLDFSLRNLIRKRVELTFQGSVMLRQDFW
jgi:hypothetical protein